MVRKGMNYNANKLPVSKIIEYTSQTFITYILQPLCQYTGMCYVPVHTNYLYFL